MRPRVAATSWPCKRTSARVRNITNVREVTTAKMTEWLKEKKRARRSTETLRSCSRDLRAWLP
jgi:hypothetical protein